MVPMVTYTFPEVASVGMTATEAQEQGRMVKEGLFAFAVTGRALAMAAQTGFVKVVGDAQSDQLLGVHVIGPCAGELIAEAAMAMAQDISVKEYSSVIRAHPTLAESLHEAALDADGIAIHKIRR